MKKELSVAMLFCDGMVLQRDKEISIWGTAAPGTAVSASISDANGNVLTDGKAEATADGNYMIKCSALSANRDCTLNITAAEESITISDVMIGDIWLAGGQSNMEFFMKYDKDWESLKNEPANPNIRMFNVPQVAFEGHTTHSPEGRGYWFTKEDNGFQFFSAPGYAFAKNIQPTIDVPVGIIGCNWGGSSACTWVSRDVLNTPELDYYLKEYDDAIAGIDEEVLRKNSMEAWAFEESAQHGADFEPLMYGRDRDWQEQFLKNHAGEPVVPMGPYNFNRPAGLYTHMLRKLIPYAIKGVIWYQGESDCGERSHTYHTLFSALINSWRKEWNDDFPFIFVQLAPFGKWLECGNDDYKIVRSKQEQVAETVKDAYVTSIMDIGSYYDIHPKTKQEVGRRLALLALGHVYNQNILCDSPKFTTATYKNGQIIVTFKHADGLHISNTGSTIVIEIDGWKYEPSKVEAIDDRLVITLPQDAAARDITSMNLSIGYDDYATIYILNSQDLCVLPFTTSVRL